MSLFFYISLGCPQFVQNRYMPIDNLKLNTFAVDVTMLLRDG